LVPSRVEQLYVTYWEDGQIVEQNLATLEQVRDRVKMQINFLRNDHKRILNPTPYKITVSKDLYDYMHELWLEHAPIGELN